MSKVDIFTPLENWDKSKCSIFGGKNCPVKIFLAGTIDNGDSSDWQQELIDEVKHIELKRSVSIYNPRREEWPSADNHREINKQIEWELYHLEKADMIVMNILADSKSPISLMELGLFAKEGRLMVFCPKTFYRYDNVMMVCKRYNVPLFTTNNIPYITEKVCNYIGIDEEAEKKKKMEEEREIIKNEISIADAAIASVGKYIDTKYGKWVASFYKERAENKKKDFEEKYGESLCSEKVSNTET